MIKVICEKKFHSVMHEISVFQLLLLTLLLYSSCSSNQLRGSASDKIEENGRQNFVNDVGFFVRYRLSKSKLQQSSFISKSSLKSKVTSGEKFDLNTMDFAVKVELLPLELNVNEVSANKHLSQEELNINDLLLQDISVFSETAASSEESAYSPTMQQTELSYNGM